jgi:putative aminopeptidase FrvX
MFDLIKELTELPGPGGDEWQVQEWLTKRWQDRVDQITSTPVGNLIAKVGGSGPRIMLAAHADEICFVVKYIDDDGFVWLASGQRNPEQRPSLRSSVFLPWGHPARIVTATGPVDCIFATLTGHVLTPEQRAKTEPDWNDIFLDLGAQSREEVANRGVQVGDRVIWNPPTRRMGDYVYGKAMDDRVCLAIMDRLLDTLDRERLAYEVVFVSTVQEEIGLVGAEAVADQVGADLALALDVGLVGDVPGVDPRDASARLGGGPTIVHKDLSHYSRPLTLALMDSARSAAIPVQPAVFNFYGSDAGAFTRHGLRSGLVVVPTRYTHSPFEMVHLVDVAQTVRLLKHFLEQPA